jgi:sensor histidine kinase YesM
MTLTYFNIYYLMPRFLYTKKYYTYAGLIVLSLFAMLLAKFNLTYYLVSTDVMPEAAEEVNSLTLNYVITTMLGELYVVSFVTAIKITIDWLNEHHKLHELERRQLTTELKFLRSQVSPHFFFNTLNNIYSLTLEKSGKASEVVLKLSELMRYLLYASRKSEQDLESEIECIQNYIDLERLRLDQSLKVDISVSGDLRNKRIAPMLLIPFIENCFKHGASKNIGEMRIVVDIKVENGFLHFRVANTIPQNSTLTNSLKRSGGIGLSNVKKRLELGYDRKDYDLLIFEEKKMYHVNLKLKV